MTELPCELAWLFPDVDLKDVDPQRHRNTVLTRVLERGGLTDVQWALRFYGEDVILDFFRHVGSTEISPRTLSFWRAYFQAGDERWADPGSFRKNNPVPWRF